VKTAPTLLRISLWLEGILLILRTPQVIATVTQNAEAIHPGLAAFWRDLGARLDDVMPVLGMCCFVTVWGMMSGKKWADRASLILSLLHLMLFPFFLPFGILGIYVWKQSRTNKLSLESMNARWQEPVPTALLPGAMRLLVALSIIAMTVTLFRLVRHSQVVGDDSLVPAFALPVLLAAIYGALVLLHDLGFWFGGHVSGFDFDVVPFGFLQFEQTDTGWQARKRDTSIWRYLRVGSQVTRTDRIDSRLFVHLLGGPMCELVFGLIAFAAAVSLPSPTASEVAGLFALVAFGRFLMNVALMRTSEEDFTDGARLLQLWNREPEGERWCALHLIAQSQGSPVAPRDWQEAWVLRVSADPESPIYAAGCFYAYAHYLDKQNLEKAAEYLDRLKSIPDWRAQERIAVEVSFFEAFTDQRSSNDAIEHPKLDPALNAPSGMRMLAMSLCHDGYTGEAAQKVKETRKALREHRQGGGWDIFEKSLLDQIEVRIQESRNAKEHSDELPAIDDVPASQFAELLRRTAM
jgi:hypothetical protein